MKTSHAIRCSTAYVPVFKRGLLFAALVLFFVAASAQTNLLDQQADWAAMMLDDDAGISDIITPQGGSTECNATSITPEIALHNYGNNPLTSVTINYNLDGGPNQTYAWVGNLTTGATTNITLPTMAVSIGAHTFNVATASPNGNTDSDAGNDANAANFTNAVGSPITLTVNTDCWGYETYWEILDHGTTNIVASGGNSIVPPGGLEVAQANDPGAYGDETTITENVCLAAVGCYDFVIYDDDATGMFGSQIWGCNTNGSYTIEDDQGNVLAQTIAPNADFEISETNQFCLGISDNAGISDIITPLDGSYECNATSITPEVTLRNYGNDPLTSVTINYDLDGGPNQTYAWVGNLTIGATANIILPTMAISTGAHTFNVATANPNGNVDGFAGNDANASNFSSAVGNPITLTVNADCYSYETYWEIIDQGTSNVVASGGNSIVPPGGQQVAQITDPGAYDAEAIITENLCLATGCYDFVIYDDYGDGMYGSQYVQCTVNGNYIIEDGQGNVLAQMIALDADFGVSETNQFCAGTQVGIAGIGLEQGISIYPNPTRGEFILEILTALSSELQIKVTDVRGRLVYNSTVNVSGAYRQQIDLTHEEKGMYFIHVLNEEEQVVRKVMKQ